MLGVAARFCGDVARVVMEHHAAAAPPRRRLPFHTGGLVIEGGRTFARMRDDNVLDPVGARAVKEMLDAHRARREE